MKLNPWIGLLSLVIAFAATSCRKGDDGIPNNSGSSHQDERTDSENQKGFDGQQEILIPESRH